MCIDENGFQISRYEAWAGYNSAADRKCAYVTAGKCAEEGS